MRNKIFFYFLLIGLLPLGITFYYEYGTNSQLLKEKSFEYLTSIRLSKKRVIEKWITRLKDDVVYSAESDEVISAMKDFKQAYAEIPSTQFSDSSLNAFENKYLQYFNPSGNSDVALSQFMPKENEVVYLQNKYCFNSDVDKQETAYQLVHDKYHQKLLKLSRNLDAYDFILVDNEKGNIVYSTKKDVDFATNLKYGPYSRTNLGQLYQDISYSENRHLVKMCDFKYYPPTNWSPAAFIGTPIYEGNKRIGVLMLQLSIDEIDDVMTSDYNWQKDGFGVSGESYIVGDDYTMRNTSRFYKEDPQLYFSTLVKNGIDSNTINRIKSNKTTILAQTVNSDAAKLALSGKSGTELGNDYRGIGVISSYAKLDVFSKLGMPNVNWAIIAQINEEEALKELYVYRERVLIIVTFVFLFIIFLSRILSQSMSNPIRNLVDGSKAIARGQLYGNIQVMSNDEIGYLTQSFNEMAEAIRIKNSELESQNATLDQRNKDITSSIKYAKRIQEAILPPTKLVREWLPNSFVLYKPKDIVSGDFYWMETIVGDSRSKKNGDTLSTPVNGITAQQFVNTNENTIVFAVVDCTGHGVPGAIVSMVGHNGLNRCLKEFGLIEPAKILDKLNELVEETFDAEESDVKDGMDLAVCTLDTDTNVLQYAGANNPLWIFRKQADSTFLLEEIKADRQPIGKYTVRKPFTNHIIQLHPGDSIYIFSDGFADQFGGPHGKKFKYSQFRELLYSLQTKDMTTQGAIINQTLEDWIGPVEQVDDICVIGVKI